MVELTEVIEEVKLDLAPQLKAAGAEIEIDIDAWPLIRFSENNLRSAINNLISHAVKYKLPKRLPLVRSVAAKTLNTPFYLPGIMDGGWT